MRKVVIHAPGGYDELRVETHPVPEPGPGEVRIGVRAIGVNYADCIIRMGLYESAKKYVGWPITPGFEVAGRIDAVGAGVAEWKVGEPVVAVTRFGGYAEQVVVPRHQVFARPPSVTPEQAAAFSAVHLTAWYGLFELAHPRPGSVLLVHSAAGGVGGALVQLGKLAGCQVVGVVGRSHKVEVARELGADVVVDKSRQDLWKEAERAAPTGYDVVFDANGVETLRQSYEHLAPGGRLVVYGFHSMLPRGAPLTPVGWARLALAWLRTPRFDPIDMTGRNANVMAFNLSYLFEREDLLAEAMGQLLGWVRDERLHQPRIETFPLAEVGRAHRALETGETVGKLVLVP